MHRIFIMFLVLVGVIALSNCAGNPYPPPQHVTVTVTNAFTSIQVGTAAVTLNAVVKGDKHNAGVNWLLTVANVNCSPACGTLTSPGGPKSLSAVYTPPATTPLNQSATISAVSADDSAGIFAFDFTIQASISVTITNKFTQQLVGSSGVVVTSTVANDNSNAGVTWTLTAGGSACSPACGVLTASAAPSFSAAYMAPATQPTGAAAMPTITATSVTDPTKNDSFSFSIVAATAILQGNYTFLLRGYDGSGIPMALGGSISADGNGNITAGEIDINDGGGITLVPSATGNYTIDASFNNVPRGTITITGFTFPNSSVHPSFKMTMSGDGKRGKIIELDGTGFLNAGTIAAQDSTAITGSIPAASYAFGFDSDSPVGGRIVEAGQFVLGSGGVTGGLVDESKAANANPIYSGATVSPDVATAPDASGRGTFTLTINGNSTKYAYYIVNANQLNAIEIDQGLLFGTVQAGVARAQASLSADSVNTSPASVLQMTGMDAIPGTPNGIGPDVIIGVMTISTANGFSMTFDANDLGTVFRGHPTTGIVTSFDPATGRGVLSNDGGFNAGFVNSAVFYLYATGSGFIIDADPSTPDGTPPDQAVTNNAFSGTFVTQTGTPFNAQSISGNLLALSGASAIPDIPNIAAAVNANSQAGTLSAAGDATSLNSQEGNLPGITFNGAYTITDTNLGHGSGTLPAGFFGFFQSNAQIPVSFYVIAPNQFVLIGQENGAISGISFFDPE